MKKFSLLFFVFALIIQYAFAQDGYKGGFIIDNNGQYIYGYVRLNPLTYFSVCEFKESLEEKPTTYSPEEIKGYGFIPGDSYISFKTVSNKWIFLLIVKKEKIALYKSGDDLFLQKGDLQIQALPSNDKNAISNTLNDVVGDCPYLKKKIKSIEISENSLLELIEQYNQCLELGGDKYKGNSQLMIMAGIAPSSLGFYPEEYQVSYLSGDNFNSFKSIAAGAVFSHKFQTLTKQKLSIGAYIGALYVSNTYERIYSTQDPANFNIIYQSDIDIYNQGITIPFGLQLTHESKLQPYLKIGTVVQPWSNSSSSGSLYTKIGGSDIYYDEPYSITEIKSGPKFQLAIGLSTKAFQNKRLAFELNVAKGKANSTVGAFSVDSDIQQLQFLVGLIF